MHNGLLRYPFSAVAGQEHFKLALLLVAVNPLVGGVLVSGPRGSAKSTLAKGLADILPGEAAHERPFVTLPLGASEEMLIGTLDLQQVLEDKKVGFQPGLLSKAHSGVLYVDEVNLLGDNLVDQLLDVVASGVNIVERDGVSHSHEASFILLGTMNPDEGELRPQLSDRFGLCVHLSNEYDVDERIQIVKLRESFDRNPLAFVEAHDPQQVLLREKIRQAQAMLGEVCCPDHCRKLIAQRCNESHVDGLRADIVWVQAALAKAALESRVEVCEDDVVAVEELVLAHRRNQPPHNPPSQPNSRDSRPRNHRLEQNESEPKSDKVNDKADGDWGAMAPIAQKTVSLPQVQLPRAGLQPARPKSTSLFAVKNKLSGGSTGRRTEAKPTQKVDWFRSLIKNAGQWPLKQLCYGRASCGANIIHLVLLDTSGSVLANQSFAKAKGLILQLVNQAYLAREWVVVLGFGNQKVETLMGLRRAPKKMKAILDGLQAGGGTPLNDALTRAVGFQSQCDKKYRSAVFKNYIITDGRVNSISPETSLQGETVVVDVEHAQVKRGKAQKIANVLNAQYFPLMA